jgi:hypothetical protein
MHASKLTIGFLLRLGLLLGTASCGGGGTGPVAPPPAFT